MNIPHELNRTGEACRWERFWKGGTPEYSRVDPSIKCFCCNTVSEPIAWQGNVDRAFEEVYADE